MTTSSTTATGSAASQLSVQERLLLAQAVYKLGAVSWPGVSKLLLQHPCCVSRPAELFSPEACEANYVELMTSIGINIPAPDAMKPQAKVHLRLAQTFYLARMQELQTQIASYESRFSQLMREISALRAGELDGEIRSELRATLARKYGKRLLDTWVPEVEDVKNALAKGPIKEGEVDGDQSELKEEDTEKVLEEAVTEDVDMQDQAVADEEEIEEEEAEAADSEDGKETAGKKLEEDVEGVVEEENQDEEEVKSETEAETEAAHSSSKETSPAPSNRSELSPAPGSDLSPPPSDKATPTPAPEDEEEEPAPTTRRSNKRRASTQPRGAPAPKRSGRRSAAAAAAATTASPAPESEAASDAGEVEMKAEQVDDEPDVEVEEEEQEPEVPATRGRRAAKRDRESTSRAPHSSSKKPQESPAASTRTKDSSPAVSRRAPSVSSTTSVTPGGQEERRSSRRSLKHRELRDDVVSKSVRGQSAALENDEEADEAEEKKPSRASGRRRGTIVAQEVSTPSEKRGTRASAKTARDSVDDDAGEGGGGQEGDVSGDLSLTMSEIKNERDSRAATASTSTPVHGTRGRAQAQSQSQGGQKISSKMLLSLLDTISSHRNGNVFQNPVKKSEASDYFDIIKRPMDLKTMRSKIKDGQISTIDEFERDTLLIFANAMMYNGPKSQVYDMAKEMLKDAEGHIRHFKNVQHHVRG